MSEIYIKKLSPHPSVIRVDTIYGGYTIDEPVLCELIASHAVQRLKKINQYGPQRYLNHHYQYTRFEHSLGVCLLLKRFGADLQEQIAGLLHDVSHTVFSHVGDYIFHDHTRKDAYQDEIHQWYIEQTDIVTILSRHGFTVEQILHKNGRFVRLEQELPNMCADRLEYTLYGGYKEGLLTHQDVSTILAHLAFQNGKWFFTQTEYAVQFAHVSLYLTMHLFATPENHLIYQWLADAINRAVTLGVLTLQEIHFSVDDQVWDMLLTHQDQTIRQQMHKIYHVKQYYTICDAADAQLVIYPKFRGINPWVTCVGRERLLTQVNDTFQRIFTRDQETMKRGYPIRLH